MKKIISAVCIMLLSCMVLMAQSPSQQITAWQYYFNTDPGQGIAGNGAIIPVTPAASVTQTLNITLPLSLSNGFHQLYIRAKDEDNRWSIAERRGLFIMTPSVTQPLTAMEYYFDTDPGVGNGTPIAVTPGNSITHTAAIVLPVMAPGFHQLYIRAKNAGGRWSIAERRGFFILSQTVSQNIVALQYYFNTDPGQGIAGNGAVIPVTPGTTIVTDTSFNVPTGLGCTPALYIRYKDSSGRWSIAERKTFDNPHTVAWSEFTTQRTGNVFYFESEMLNRQSHSWNFDDGSAPATVAQNPSHTFTTPGEYDVCLTVSNSACGARTTCHNVSFPGLAEHSPTRHAPIAGFVGDISGGGFVAGTTFKYIGVGADIVPSSTILGSTSRARIFCDLTGKPAGSRHLVVIIPGQDNDTLFDALNILSTYTAAAGVKPALDISGPMAIFSGTAPEKFVVSLTNNTDETMYGVPVFIEIPPIDETFISNIIPDGSAWSTPQNVFIDKFDSTTMSVTRKAAWLIVPYLAPGVTEDIRFELSSLVPLTSTIKAAVFPAVYTSVNGPGSPTFDCDTIPVLFQNWFNMLPPPVRYPNGFDPGCWIDGWMDIVPYFPWGDGSYNGNGLANAGGYHVDDGIGLGFTTPQAFADFWGLPLVAYGDDKSGGEYDDSDWGNIVNPCPGCWSDILERILEIPLSIDPNYKSGSGNFTSDNYTNGYTPLTYQVHFENLSSATAPASFVTVTDVIDTSKFDMTSFTFKSYGFADFNKKVNLKTNLFTQDVNMNPVKNVVVRTIGELNENGLLDWKMLTYTADTMNEISNPFLGFLDPNVVAPEGEGYIEFSVLPKPTLSNGDVINNEASITFDFNAPIITNTWSNKIDKVNPSSNVEPLPAVTNDSVINIIVTRNDANSGVLDYELYLSENNGPWKVRRYLTADTIKFAGNHGSTYRFYSVARDRVLNIENVPASHDASTTLDTTRTVYYADADGDGFGNALAPVLAYVLPIGYVTNNTDCNDTLSTAYPGATEIFCNGIDENCNGMTDDGVASTDPTSANTNATNDEICAGNSVTLTVNGGSLGTGAAWNWYSNSCTGALVGSGSSLTLSPATTTTYYVKAVGLCNSTLCVPVTVNVKAAAPSSSVVMPFINLPAYACNGTAVSNIGVAAVAGASQYIFDGPTGTTFNGSNPYVSSTPTVNIVFGNPNGSGYYIGVQAANACGTSNRKSQWVRGSVGVPASITPASGILTHCANTVSTFTCPAVTGATQYQWTISGDATVSGTGTTATVTFGPAWNGGTLCVAAQTTCFTSASKCIVLTTSASSIGPISGTFIACPGQTLTYSVANVPGAASYNWVLPAGASGVSSTNSINVTFGTVFTSGDIKVQVTSVCGVVSDFRSTTIYSGVPPRPASIAGPLNGLCSQTIVFTCPAQSGVTFSWTVPAGATINSGQGTNAISVTFGVFSTGSVCVTASTACGTSAARCITVNGKPAVPGAITAIPSSWCANTSGVEFNVDVTPLTGSYILNWLYPGSSVANYVLGGGNSTSLILNWLTGSGSVNVTSSNACGNSTRTSTQANSCREEEQIDNINSDKIYVYPNPVKDYLNIEFMSDENQNASLQMLDLAGKLIVSRDIGCVDGLNKSTINVSKLARGVYFIEVTTQHKLGRKKVIID